MDELPVVCALTPAEQLARAGDLLPGLLPHAVNCVELSNGYRLVFDHQPDLLIRIASAVEHQRQCCRFLRFTVRTERNLGQITLEVSGHAGSKAFLTDLLAPNCADSDRVT